MYLTFVSLISGRLRRLRGFWALLWLLLMACEGACGSAPQAHEEAQEAPATAGASSASDPPPERLGDLRVRWVGTPGDGPVVVLLHGWGAPGDDLVPFARELSHAGGDAAFVLPEAPLERPGGGRAWWHIPREVIAQGTERDMAGMVPEGLAEARRAIHALLGDLERELGVDPSDVVLGGFSQGAMLALDAAIHNGEPLAGVAVLSGTLLAAEEWLPRLGMLEGVPVFLSHGRSDHLLAFDAAETLRDHLEEAGAEVRWVPFGGGHGILPTVRRALTEWLARVTAS